MPYSRENSDVKKCSKVISSGKEAASSDQPHTLSEKGKEEDNDASELKQRRHLVNGSYRTQLRSSVARLATGIQRREEKRDVVAHSRRSIGNSSKLNIKVTRQD